MAEPSRIIVPARSDRAERFDQVMLLALAALVIAIVLVVLRGDQVGLGVQSYTPNGTGSIRSAIRIVFDQPIAGTISDSSLSIIPAIAGKLAVEGSQIIFRPAAPLQQGQEYKVRLQAGIRGADGRQLKQDMAWSFLVGPPRIAYLGPTDKLAMNLYVYDPAAPQAVIPLTSGSKGVIGYDVAPDGSGIVYAEQQEGGEAHLFWIDLATKTSRLFYRCADAVCTNPVFRPDGGVIAFERTALNSGTGLTPGVPRVWIVDAAGSSAKPLFADGQQLGYSPKWSPDGTKLAVFNVNASGIVVHDFTANRDVTIQTVQGEVGQFSPDGRWIYFPKVIKYEGEAPSASQYITHLVLVDLTSPYLVQRDLVPDRDPADDKEATWFPNGKNMLVARTTQVEGLPAPQLYVVDLATGSVSPLLEDQVYSHSNMLFSPLGDQLLFQRFPLGKPGARSEIWTYNFNTRALQRVIQNATFAKWIP